MWLYMMILLITIGLFGLLGWMIKYRQYYGLISGFANRSEKEKEQLIQNGYPQKTGDILLLTAMVMLLLLPIAFTSFPYFIEVQLGFMITVLMGGFIYLSKYEIPSKRKRSYIISSIIAFLSLGFVITIFVIGYQNTDLIIKETTFEIKGPYGNEWNLDDVTEIQLMNEMPEVTWKINGFGMATVSKGYFKVVGYGKSLLFIIKEGPYIYMKVNDQPIFINGDTVEKTREWYEELKRKVSEESSGRSNLS
jgi:hypothetical protein